MAYDEEMADRIRAIISSQLGLTEKKMFGGLGFMIDGHMAVAAGSKGQLMVRNDPANSDLAAMGVEDLELVAPMEMRGKPMAGWLLVQPEAVAEDSELTRWIDHGVGYVRTLPPKEPKKR